MTVGSFRRRSTTSLRSCRLRCPRAARPSALLEDGAEVGYYPIRFYNRRLVKIAQRKMALGIYGNHNAGRRPKLVGFSVRTASWVMLFHGLARWAKAELANAWTYVVKPRPIARPAPAASAAAQEPRSAAAGRPPAPASDPPCRPPW